MTPMTVLPRATAVGTGGGGQRGRVLEGGRGQGRRRDSGSLIFLMWERACDGHPGDPVSGSHARRTRSRNGVNWITYDRPC